MSPKKIDPAVTDALRDAWFTLRAEDEWPAAKDVQHLALRRLREQGKQLQLPSERAVYNIMEEAQRSWSAIASDQKQLDQQWSVGHLATHPIDPGAVPSVLRAWKYSLIKREAFMLRQALWVARLSGVTNDTATLWALSRQYAANERTYQTNKHPPEIVSDDFTLVMGIWELATMRLLGSEKASPTFGNTPEPLHLDELAIFRLAHDTEPPSLPDTEADRLSELMNQLEPRSIHDLQWTREAKSVYLLWLGHIADSPQWPNLPPEDTIRIITTLREWIGSHHCNTPDHRHEAACIPFIYQPIPADLSHRVGFNPPQSEPIVQIRGIVIQEPEYVVETEEER